MTQLLIGKCLRLANNWSGAIITAKAVVEVDALNRTIVQFEVQIFAIRSFVVMVLRIAIGMPADLSISYFIHRIITMMEWKAVIKCGVKIDVQFNGVFANVELIEPVNIIKVEVSLSNAEVKFIILV